MACEGILESCNECGVCVDECLFLEKYGLTPLQAVLDSEARKTGAPAVASEQVSGAPFSCLLCGLCDAVCPSQLSPTKMFAALRAQSAANSSAVTACRPFFSDRKYNLYTIYRSANSIDYSDISRMKAKTVLFPGCSLGTFFPKLTRALFDNLRQSEPELGLLADCCQKPLKDLGLTERYEKATANLAGKLDEMGVETIITACPSCLRDLAERFKDRRVVSCYSIMHPEKDLGLFSFGRGINLPLGSPSEVNSPLKITVHDSCSDREAGIVGHQVRSLLSKTYQVEMVEMVHSGRNSLCCGSGGLVPAVDPKLSMEFNRLRIGEAERSGAEVMVTYCATCSNAFRNGGNTSGVEIRHVLELLLEVKEDYDSVRRNLDRLFVSGPRKEFYAKLMASSP